MKTMEELQLKQTGFIPGSNYIIMFNSIYIFQIDFKLT